MKQLSFLELAKRVLAEEKRPLSADEIWDIAKQKGYDAEVSTKGKTPAATIGARLYVDIRDQSDSPFCKVGSRPARFFLKQLVPDDARKTIKEAVATQPVQPPKPESLERALHPFLSYFAFLHLRAYTKTIQHSRSEKKEYGEWVHPDLVGCYFPLKEWQTEVFELSTAVGNTTLRLYSFELKRELSFANLRESFFQTVSNSSWANEAYLVAAKVSGDGDFRSELRRLSTSFGIGVIELNVAAPDSSEIVFPATRKEVLDWDMINKLATMNSDFKEFLKRVRNDIQSKEIREEWYDKVYKAEELAVMLKK